MKRKILSVIVTTMLLIVGVFSMTTESKATTQKELEEYFYEEHTISGVTYIIRDTDKVKLQKFFNENNLTDEQATKIKELFDKAMNLMNTDGAAEPNKISTQAKKTELISYAQEIASILGYTVSYDATETRLDIYKDGNLIDSLFWGVTPSKDGKKVATTEPKLLKTGSTNYEYIIVPCIALIVGGILVIARRKANE